MKFTLNWLRTSMAAVLAVSYLGTQCAFAYQPEKGFWTERRKAAQRQSPTLLASVPVGHTVIESLAHQFPSTQQVSPTLSPSVAPSVPKGFIKDHAPLLSALSPSYGSIRKVCLPKTGSPPGPLILHIQDVHMNADAQRNIGATVRALMDSGQVGLIALEGSTEEINLQPFADTPHRQAVQMTADYLLRENKISGPIHAALTHAGQLPRILGIDDPVHYEANVQAYRTSAPLLEKTRQEMKGFEREMEAKKKSEYSPALFAYDQKVQAYRAGRFSLQDYVKTLTSANETGRSNLMAGSLLSPSLRCFLGALKMEQTLDFKKVEAERTRLLDRLTRALTPEETNALLAQSLAYRSGQLRYADFYGQLKTFCQKSGIPLSEFPSMDAYVRYVLLADKIDAEQLLEDLGNLENAIYARLIKTAEERKLVHRARHLWLTGKLVDFSLIPSEWKEYQRGIKLEGLHSFESFYDEAQARDTAMANHLLKAIKEDQKKSGTVTLLVTGGYHAEGMAQQLTAQGATVISYVPKIEKIDTAQGAAYLSVFTQEKTPLEKLVQGDKLFLAVNPASREMRTTILPALFVMVLVGLLGNISGIDPNAVYHAMGGIGVLALGKILKDSISAQLRVGDETGHFHVNKDGERVGLVKETFSFPVNRATEWIRFMGAYSFGWVKRAVRRIWSFYVLRAFHKGLNEKEEEIAEESGDKKTSSDLSHVLAFIPVLRFAPDLAEGAVRITNVVNAHSILGFLTLIALGAFGGGDWLYRYNSSLPQKDNPANSQPSSRTLTFKRFMPTVVFLELGLLSTLALARDAGQLFDVTGIFLFVLFVVPAILDKILSREGAPEEVVLPGKSEPVKALAPSKDKNLATIELAARKLKESFYQFAGENNLNPKGAHFYPVRNLTGTNRYTMAIAVGKSRFIGHAIEVKTNRNSPENGSAALFWTKIVPVRGGKLAAEESEGVIKIKNPITPPERAAWKAFKAYAEINNLDFKKARFFPARKERGDLFRVAIRIGTQRYLAEIKGAESGGVAEVSILTPDDASRGNRSDQGGNIARSVPGPILQPNNILFLKTGKWARVGFVLDAVFLLGMAAAGASLACLLPLFAFLHVCLEVQNNPNMPPQERVIRFLSHLIFTLLYGIPDFSNGVFHVLPLIGSAVAVVVHGAYDQYTIGLDDGMKMGLLKTGTAAQKVDVLLGGPGRVTDALGGGIVSETPEFLQRVSNSHRGYFYSLGLRHGVAKTAGEKADIPVVEKPVGTPAELAEMIALASGMRDYNKANPTRSWFLTVTPSGGMTLAQIAGALTDAGIPDNMVYVKKVSAPLSFSVFGNEFEKALKHFKVRPEKMFLILAGKPEIGDLRQWTEGLIPPDDLRQALLKALMGSLPVIVPPVILDMLKSVSLIETSA